MRFLFELGDLSRLDKILVEMRRVEGVFEARRMLAGEATQKKKGDH
jgi:GTP pyrophosphokinase